MAEWSIAVVLKTIDCNRSGGSNPSLSAEKHCKTLQTAENKDFQRFFYFPKIAEKCKETQCFGGVFGGLKYFLKSPPNFLKRNNNCIFHLNYPKIV